MCLPSIIPMIQRTSSLRVPRSGLTVFTVAAVLCAGWWFAPVGQSQAPAFAATSNAALSPLLAKLKTEQDQIAANQTKIEAQTAQLKEEIRQVKLYAARGGSGHR